MKKLINAFVFTALIACLCVSVIAQDANQVFNPDLFKDLKYRNIGPSRGGRATTVTGVATQPETFYMGTTGGGVWKTTDYGQRWVNISDGYFETGSMGAIQVADSDPNIIYAGTGSDGIRSNVITGRGIYKSTDAGRTWTFKGLRNVGQIGAVEVHPENPDIVFVAGMGHAFGPGPERGVYRSIDGGSNWDKVHFISEKTGCVDLEFSPDNPNEIYACMWRGERKPWTIISGDTEGGVYKSADGGDTWTHLTNGLPQNIIGKSDLAVSKADPNRVYVLMEAPEGEGGLYRSDDRGETFRLVTTQRSLLDRPFYYLNIDADPSNADVLYSNSTGFYKSEDGGETWQRRSTPHGDNHDIWINPNDPDLYIQCNDGGANVTRDNGRTWSTQNNQLTAEIYQVAVDDQFPYWVYGGQQDNSTIMVPSIPPYSPAVGPTGFWRAIGGCETGPAVPKPGNHNIVYSNCKGRFGRYNKITGQEKQYYVGASNMYGHNPRDLKYRFQRVSPIHISPHDPNIVYHASQFLHKTTDEGVTWETISPDLTENDPSKQVISGSPITRDITGEEFYSTIYAVQESPVEQGVIWVGANDGPVHVTRNGGETWENVTPPDMPKGGRVQTVEPSPHDAAKAYFAAYRYLLDDWEPYIYRTNDYGKTWTRLTTGTNGIPADSPTRVIREDPDREGLLYAGTEFAMYVSFDDGAHWQSLQLNLPATPITDIKIYRNDMILSTMGRSFWILDNLTPLRQVNASTGSSGSELYKPKDAYRMRYRGSRGGSGPEYPQSGAVIDYYFANNQVSEVTIEITDEKGKLVRLFSSEPVTRGGVTSGDPLEAVVKLERFGTTRIPKTAGMHRFVWDLSSAGSWDPNPTRAGRGGPMVVPGTYFIMFKSANSVQSASFKVLPDPRIEEDGVTQEVFEEQFEICVKIRDLISRAKMAEFKISNALQIASGSNKTNLEGLLAKMVTARGTYQTPMLMAQLNYLNGMLNRADQKPGKDAYDRYEELDERLNDIITEMQGIPGIR